MSYSAKEKKTIKTLFYEGGKDIIKGFTKGRTLTDIMNKQVKIEKAELKAEGIDMTEDEIFTGLSWGIIQRLKDTSKFPTYLRESEEENINLKDRIFKLYETK